MLSREIVQSALLIALVEIGGPLFPLKAVAASPAEADVVSLTLALVQKEGSSSLIADLINSGSQPLILNLGMMLANGRQQYMDRIQLELTTVDKKVLHLRMRGPGVVAGRIDPMIVPLPPGATYSVLLDLNQYCAPDEQVWRLQLRPGSYPLRAKYTGVGVPQHAANLDMKGISLMPNNLHSWFRTNALLATG